MHLLNNTDSDISFYYPKTFQTVMQRESQDLSLEEQAQESVPYRSKRYVKSQILRHPTRQKIRQLGNNFINVKML